jgi:hypothetical protein
MEKILRIEEGDFKTDPKDWNDYEGYLVVTDQQTIKVGISSGQSCCENFGYLSTNDDLKEFEGANLLSVEVVDEALNNKKIEELEYLDAGGAMFVNFKTDRGVLQLVAYNGHNGYYGHSAVLISKQLNHEDSL